MHLDCKASCPDAAHRERARGCTSKLVPQAGSLSLLPLRARLKLKQAGSKGRTRGHIRTARH